MEMQYAAQQYYHQTANCNLQPYWTPIWIPNHPSAAPVYAEHVFMPSYPVQNGQPTVYYEQPSCEPAYYPATDATPNQTSATYVDPNYCNYFQHSIVMVHYPMYPPFQQPPEQMPIPCEMVNYNCAPSFDSGYGMCYNGECIEPCFLQLPTDQCGVQLIEIETEHVPFEKILPSEIYCEELSSVSTLDAAHYGVYAMMGQNSICVETIHISDNHSPESDLEFWTMDNTVLPFVNTINQAVTDEYSCIDIVRDDCIKSPDSQPVTSTPVRTHKCPDCSQSFYSNDELQYHIKEELLRCHECDECIKKMEHQSERCQQCGRQPTKPFICMKCRETFLHYNQLVQHGLICNLKHSFSKQTNDSDIRNYTRKLKL